MGKSAKYCTSTADAIPVDGSLKPEDGWRFGMRWLIDEQRLGSQHGAVGHAVFPPGHGRHELHLHEHAEEVTFYLKGHAQRIIGDEQFEVGPGDIGFVPVGVPHALINLSETEPIELICVYLGAPSVEKTGYRHIKGRTDA